MRAAMRALSIATAILWLTMGIFVATAIYSATLIRFDVKGPILTTEDTAVVLKLNITIHNGGFHDITNLTFKTYIYLVRYPISVSVSGPYSVKSGGSEILPHAIRVDLAEIAENETLTRTLVLEDVYLNITLVIELAFAYVVKTELEANFTFPWGALMSGFDVYAWRVIGSTLEVDVSFANNSPLAYQFQLEALNSTRGHVGISDPQLMNPNSTFSGTVDIPLQMAYWTPAKWYLVAHLFVASVELVVEVWSHG